MKINGAGVNKIVNLYNNNAKAVEKKETVKKSDTVEISSIGKSLSSYSVDGNFETSAEKLESIRKQISSGTYKSNSEMTAKKIIDIIKGREV